METEKKKVLVKFIGVILLGIAILFLLNDGNWFFLLGMILFAISIVLLILYNVFKEKPSEIKPGKQTRNKK